MNAVISTRRQMLLGLAAASAFAAGSLPSLAGASAAPENSALLALGEELDGAVAQASAAIQAFETCVRDWQNKWPTIPDALASSGGWGSHVQSFLGGGTYGPDGRPICALTSAGISADIETIRKAIKRKRKYPSRPFHVYLRHTGFSGERTRQDWSAGLEQLRDLQHIAARYEQDQARIHKASRVLELKAHHEASQERLDEIIGQVMTERPETMEGLVIQAQALEAGKGLDKWRISIRALESNPAAIFAENFIRIAGVRA